MLKEIAIAVRTLSKRPGYALAVVLTLALGIGATTLMFSVADAALLRPLPFHEPDRLVFLTGVAGPQRSPRGGSMPEVADWRALNETLTDVSQYDETSLNMRVGADVIRVETEMVNAGYFALLGIQPALGRTFLPEEDAVPERDAVAAISDALWRERFGGDPAILDRTIHLNDRAFAIVGVMPEGFAGLSFDTDVWVPSLMVTLTASRAIVQNRGARWLGAIGRLEKGVMLPRAQGDLDRVAGIVEQRHPNFNRQRGVQVDGLRSALLGRRRDMVVALFAAVVAEIALAMTLLTAAGLMIRSLERQMRVPLGFEPDGLTVARLTLPPSRYAPPQRATFVARLADGLRATPGVVSAAVATSLPFTGNSSASILVPEGGTEVEQGQRYYRNAVTSDFFSTLAIALKRGRTFTEEDREGAPLVAIINESAAKRLWGTEGSDRAAIPDGQCGSGG